MDTPIHVIRFLRVPAFGGITGLLKVIIAALFVGFSAGAPAGDMTTAQSPDPATGRSSVLDGRVFIGEIGGEVGDPSEKVHITDTWTFEQGNFLSSSCEDCGYPASPYQVHFEGDDIHFRSEAQCPVTDAQLVWEGTITGDRIEGVLTWTKERWYWTIEKQFRFEGQRVDTLNAALEP